MPETLRYTGQLTVVTCWCGTRHAIPEELYDLQTRQKRDGDVFTPIYCPLGHKWFLGGKSRADDLEKQLVVERARHDQTLAELDGERKNHNRTSDGLSATKGVVTRTKNRIANGVCPCCKLTKLQEAMHWLHHRTLERMSRGVEGTSAK
jgi:hypothetical protein